MELDDIAGKVEGFAKEHSEQLEQGVDKGVDFAKDKVDGHDEQIDSAADRVKGLLDQ